MNGMIMMPITPPAASALLGDASMPSVRPEAADKRCDGQHGEEAVDDRRDAGEDFQHRLDDGAKALVRIFRQVDRGQDPGRHGDDHCQQRDDEGAEQHRDHAECALPSDLVGADGDLRLPAETEQELRHRHAGEELQRFIDEREDDPGRREDGDQRREYHEPGDGALDAVARAETRLDRADTEEGTDRAECRDDRDHRPGGDLLQ